MAPPLIVPRRGPSFRARHQDRDQLCSWCRPHEVIHLESRSIMNLRRRRQEYSAAMKGDAFTILPPIAATFAVVLLWFFG